MDPSVVSALSALSGATLGGLLSLFASWLVNQRQVRAQWLAHDRAHREDLYKEFIEEAAKCHVDALLHDKPDIASLAILYAKLSRMRVLSSSRVVQSGEQLITQIVETYSRPAKNVDEVRQAIKDGSLDVIRNFSEACRTEFDLNPA
jgi:hypothetical protein